MFVSWLFFVILFKLLKLMFEKKFKPRDEEEPKNKWLFD